MKVAPVSADLLVKLGLGAGVLLALGWVLYRAKTAFPEALNPFSENNVAYHTANSIGGAIITDPAGPGKNADGSWSLGGWLFDVTHPSTAAAVAGMSGPVQTPQPAVDHYDAMGNFIGTY